MASFVKMYANPYGSPKYAHYDFKAETIPNRDLMGIVVKAARIVDKEGEEIASGKSGQHVTIEVGSIGDGTYHAFYEVHPMLYEVSSYIGKPTIIAAGDSSTLDIHVILKKSFDFSELPYIAKIFMVD